VPTAETLRAVGAHVTGPQAASDRAIIDVRALTSMSLAERVTAAPAPR
jgi:hypothetical protein